MVKRVHELYEELGRKDLQAVEEMEKEERDNSVDEIKTKTGLNPTDKENPKTTKDSSKDETDK